MKTVIAVIFAAVLLAGCYYIPVRVCVMGNSTLTTDNMTITGGPKDYDGSAEIPISVVPK